MRSTSGHGQLWKYQETNTGFVARILGVAVKLHPAFCDTPEPVLGREDFFSAFRVTLDQRATVMTLEPYADMVGPLDGGSD